MTDIRLRERVMNQGDHVMPSNTHTTATVRIQLDLSGLARTRRHPRSRECEALRRHPEGCGHGRPRTGYPDSLRELQHHCNTTYAGCDKRLATLGRTCCKPCEVRDTHKAVAWEMWRWQDRQARPNDDPEAAS